MNQGPVAVGLFLCEQVIVEENTRNITPVNCFTRRTVEYFPSGPVPFVVLALLTDGLGEMPVEVVVRRLDTLEEIYQSAVSFRFASPLQTIRCTLRVRDCSFPHPGHYDVVLLADGALVAQRKLVLLQKEVSP